MRTLVCRIWSLLCSLHYSLLFTFLSTLVFSLVYSLVYSLLSVQLSFILCSLISVLLFSLLSSQLFSLLSSPLYSSHYSFLYLLLSLQGIHASVCQRQTRLRRQFVFYVSYFLGHVFVFSSLRTVMFSESSSMSFPLRYHSVSASQG